MLTAEGVQDTETFRELGLPGGTLPHAIDANRRLCWDGTVATRIRKRQDPSANEAPVYRSDGRGGAEVSTHLAVLGSSSPGPMPEWDLWDAGVDGWVAVVRCVEQYRVDWVTPEGTLLRGPVIEEARIRISGEDRDSLLARGAAGGSTGGPGSRWYCQTASPNAVDVRVSLDGRAWVRRAQPLAERRPPLDVLDHRGVRVARYRLPESLELVGFGKGVVHATRENDVGLLWVERHRLPGKR